MTTSMNPVDNDRKCAGMSDEDLIRKIGDLKVLIAQNLVEMATYVGPASRRGVNLDELLEPKTLDMLRKIESGQIIPELAQRFLGQSIFPYLKGLPLDDQKQIAKTGRVEVAVRREDSFETRKMAVDSMNADQRKLVFSGGRIRTPTQQIEIMEQAKREQEDRTGTVEFVLPAVVMELTKADGRLLSANRRKPPQSGEVMEFMTPGFLLRRSSQRILPSSGDCARVAPGLQIPITGFFPTIPQKIPDLPQFRHKIYRNGISFR